jgi:hypothetical protein
VSRRLLRKNDKDARRMPTRYRTNAPRFVDETIDGEALIMDMVKGSYYSCVGASAFAWNALTSGASSSELARTLSSHYSIDEADVTRDAEQFVESLLAEEMLVPDDEASVPQLDTPDPVTAAEYAPLNLERYTDLADLILLDPVHDVTEAGWPHATS